MATFKVMVQEKDLEEAKKYISDRIEINLKTGCHEWKLSKKQTGYGVAKWKYTSVQPHRLSYAIANGGIIELTNEKGESLEVCHGKDCERHCCNSDHLKIGTAKDNAADKKEKGTNYHGEYAPNVTITEYTAKQIIESLYPKNHTMYLRQIDRALKFGVHPTTISQIDCNATWKYLPRKPNEVVAPKINVLKKRVKIDTEEEARAKMIIASKKHKYDPEYKTQQQRAAYFNVSNQTIERSDLVKTWGYLPRPPIKEFPKPPKVKKPFVWTYKKAVKIFETIKCKCKYSEEVNKFTETQCFEWNGALNGGRPYMEVDGRKGFSYMFACEFKEKRRKQKGEMVRHLCNNKICCEPTHLKFGTQKENTDDALRFGESKVFTINFERAREIRNRYDEGSITYKELSCEFNISVNVVNGVVNNRTWVE